MANCTSCGTDVTGKKFCPECGTPVQPAATAIASGQPALASTCPRCNGEVKPGAAFCMHCGSSLSAPTMGTPATHAQPLTRPCPNCRAEVPVESAFCTNCGQNTRVSATPTPISCTHCGHQNAPGMNFCAGCGQPLTAITASPPPMAQQTYTGPYVQQPQYPQQPQQYNQPQYPPQPQPYGQPQYPPQQYGQPQYPQQYGQAGYQPQPMLGQQPMVLRCPVCMAMAQLGTPSCPSCHTSLAGVVPTPANIPAQGQQGGMSGFLQGSGGKMAMGALGGAAAVLGGEMLLHGVENSIENRVEGDLGYGGGEYHHHHRRFDDDGNPLGEIGEIAKDIGLL